MTAQIRRLMVIATAVGLIGSVVVYLIARTMTPFDGAIFVEGAGPADPVVRVIQPYENGLRDGDRILTIEGIPIQAWADEALTGDLPRPDWQVGGTAAYSVLRDGQELDLDQPLGRYPHLSIMADQWGDWAFGIGMTLVALFAFSRKPDDRALQLLLLAGACILVLATADGTFVSDLVYPLFRSYGVVRFVLVLPFIPILILHFVLIFPKPQPWLAGRRWVLPVVYVAPFVFLLAWAIATWPGGAVTLDWLVSLGFANIASAGVYAMAILVAAMVSLRTARDPVSRTRIRWVVFAIIITVGLNITLQTGSELLFGRALVDGNLISVAQLILPVAIVISILRYNLFDIDVIIRRTTSYAIITALLALVYFGSVIVLQRLFTAATGQTSTVAIVLSTLLIAALFLPVRRRVQAVIDRRFFRQKYDAQKTLEAFAATVRDETDLDALTAELVRVIEETMQPEHVSVWLAPEVTDDRKDSYATSERSVTA